MPGRSSFSYEHKRITHNVIPYKSGVHRLSCTILYRHLLNQVPQSPLNRPLLLHVIRAEFRKDAKLRIHTEIRQSLQIGYQTLSLLQSLQRARDYAPQEKAPDEATTYTTVQSVISNGSQAAQKDRLPLRSGMEPQTDVPENIRPTVVAGDATLSNRPQDVLESTTIERKPRFYPLAELNGNLSKQIANLNTHLQNLSRSHIQPAAPTTVPPALTTYPGGNKILDRPLPKSALTGKRIVPKLVNAGGFPFLRVKKPQPPLINKILRDKQKQRLNRFTQLDELHEQTIMAADEDEWEEQMKKLAIAENKLAEFEVDTDEYRVKHVQQRQSPPPADQNDGQPEYETHGLSIYGTGYRAAILHSIKIIHLKITAEDAKQKDLTEKFWEIVKAEQKLADEEKEAVRKERVQKWLEKVKTKLQSEGVEWKDKPAEVKNDMEEECQVFVDNNGGISEKPKNMVAATAE